MGSQVNPQLVGELMSSKDKEYLGVGVENSVTDEIGRALWAMQDARDRTMRELAKVSSDMVDWLPPAGESSIGTILYHLADIEADWLYVEVLEQPFPPEIADLFTYPTRDEQGKLVQVIGMTLEEHLARLETVRSHLLKAFSTMSLDDYRRARSLPQYDVTPEWVLHHLRQHEGEHRSQIGALRIRAEGSIR